FDATSFPRVHFYPFFFHCYRDHRDLHSFPTRRSSDLLAPAAGGRFRNCPDACDIGGERGDPHPARRAADQLGKRLRHVRLRRRADRKSTRLNSSHVSISYAVFCLKKKKKK